ncbi:hypothetical protein ZIOFF_016596 [Zingiber officinale]|uniref:non-specific serine/threonine protein kinase n=1 Tax=Zingiber officinale TaxID=94328 RepID=A0A8J5LVG4_ZINOF|nr:hypothetical protein ZIOFF_016596 [Zingiber officinale]
MLCFATAIAYRKKKMNFRFWWLIQLVFAMASAGAHSQSTETLGFLSIDCGIEPGSSYVDPIANISYVSDAGFIDTGVNHNISVAYEGYFRPPRVHTLRAFPNGVRNCYTIGSPAVARGSKYLLRAWFVYGNYDGLSGQPQSFDLHLGVNYWDKVNVTTAESSYWTETITVATAGYSSIVDAMTAIKEQYRIQRNWMGDPCSPNAFVWDGLNCTYSFSNSPRVIALNLSSSGLTGEITKYVANLSALQYLDLSYNNLTGPIPDDLANLSSLKLLDLTGNLLNGSVPSNLLEMAQNGLLTLRLDGNPHLCDNVWRVRKTEGLTRGSSVDPQNGFPKQADNSLRLENRQFTHIELQNITNNFQKILGKGGFGSVFHGRLEDGTQIAVKMLSQSSSQGTKEFLAEAQHLTRVHHRNLVSLVGYCNEVNHLALVYEFMSQGTLQDHLRGRANDDRALSWRQRLHIAIDAAQGLEYLHKGCKPPLVHRDVKSGNILLSETLEAKIADFGLSKAFLSEVNSHISTVVMGTPGYLDPEYYNTFQLSEKSDVYSYGVVLLELITGLPSIVPGTENVLLVQWVLQRFSRGNIEDVVDPKLEREYDINCVWKCADIALKCTTQRSQQRPTMTEVLIQLKESLELENSHYNTGNTVTLDPLTNISYVSDAGFIDTGVNRNISGDSLSPKLRTLRAFPNGTRNCYYTIRSPVVARGSKYLLRALFLYGNYDGLDGQPLAFDLHFGVNYWDSVSVTDSTFFYVKETITVATAGYIPERGCATAKILDAVTVIKEWYRIQRNWMGDPCSPSAFVWDGLNCTYSLSNSPRVTALNLSSSGLIGEITKYVANLSALQYLDLSYNNLTGQIPDELANLSSLKLLDLASNQLNGSVPSNLLEMAQNGLLTLRLDWNPHLCNNGTLCNVMPVAKKKKISTPVIVILCIVPVLILLAVIIIVWKVRKTQGVRKGSSVDPHNDFPKQTNNVLQFENHQFTYMEIQNITNNFQKILGKGGFEFVFHGHLEDGRANNARALTWRQRLHIAIDAAQGLEYLQNGCKPPLVHRDVKSGNILLSEILEAKIADFGLSKAFLRER